MTYTVKQLSELAAISVPTLHYYDEIGLLKPSFVKDNGYRYYDEPALLRLQQILFFRELEFSLKQIIAIVNNPAFDSIEALQDQKKLLVVKRDRLNGLLETIDTTIVSLKGGEHMSDDQIYKSFDKKQMEEYREEARQKWGDDAVTNSENRMKNWTPAQKQQAQEMGDKVLKSIVSNMDKGIESPEVQADIEKYFQGMQLYYDCSYEIFRGLGKMYVEDKRFTAYYDKYHPELAHFMCDAMAYYCDTHEK